MVANVVKKRRFSVYGYVRTNKKKRTNKSTKSDSGSSSITAHQLWCNYINLNLALV